MLVLLHCASAERGQWEPVAVHSEHPREQEAVREETGSGQEGTHLKDGPVETCFPYPRALIQFYHLPPAGQSLNPFMG